MKKLINVIALVVGLSLFNSCFIIDDPYSLTLSSASEEMIEGESITLKATVSGFRTVTPEIEWSSDDPDIATVDEKGVVKAIKKGETTIVAKITYSIQARCKIIVTEDFTITFADEFFEEYCLKYFDENHDGEISRTEANLVKKIGGNDKVFCTDNTDSIPEIKYFKNLEHLDCYGSTIYAGPNGKLKILDVSNNSKLTYLDCHGNKLKTLDTSNNPNLEILRCENNQLTELNVSESIELKQLSCSHNALTSLDISNNTKLETMYCSYNNIETIYVWVGFNEDNYTYFSKDETAKYVKKW